MANIIKEFQDLVREEKRLRTDLSAVVWEKWFTDCAPEETVEDIKKMLKDDGDMVAAVNKIISCSKKALKDADAVLAKQKENMKEALDALKEDVKSLKEVDPERYKTLNATIREVKESYLDE